jgi:hypothetical protein
MFSAGYIKLELLTISHLLEETTLAVAPRSKKIEYYFFLPDVQPMHPVVCYDAGVSQHQTPRGNAAWFGGTYALHLTATGAFGNGFVYTNPV